MTSCECLSVPLSIRPVLACLQSGPRNRPPRVLILTERHTPRDLIGFMQSSTLLTLLPKYLQHPPAVTAFTVETLCRSFQRPFEDQDTLPGRFCYSKFIAKYFFSACDSFFLATSQVGCRVWLKVAKRVRYAWQKDY